MRIIFHRKFEKKYKKLPNNIKSKIKEKISIFISDLYNPELNNHVLRGKYFGYRSINIAGDLRIIYKLIDKDLAVFSDVGSHSELYS
jgi:addiction module RelE/StbE family toxin